MRRNPCNHWEAGVYHHHQQNQKLKQQQWQQQPYKHIYKVYKDWETRSGATKYNNNFAHIQVILLNHPFYFRYIYYDYYYSSVCVRRSRKWHGEWVKFPNLWDGWQGGVQGVYYIVVCVCMWIFI